NELAVEVVTVKPLGAEPGVDVTAIRSRCGVRVSGCAVAVVINTAFISRTFPHNLSALAIEAENFQRVMAIARDTVRVNIFCAFENVLWRLRAGYDFALDRGSQKNSVAPDDRRRVASSGNRRLPPHVLSGTPPGG